MVVAMPSTRPAAVLGSICIIFLFWFSSSLWSPSYYDASHISKPQPGRPIYPHRRPTERPIESASTTWLKRAEAISRHARAVADQPILPPYKDKFSTLGHRTQSARKWVRFIDDSPDSKDKRMLLEVVEAALTTSYPYLANSPKHPGSKTPFTDLRRSFKAGSRGVVIPTGKSTLRFATHLISGLQDALQTSLPIMIVYAGEKDLPANDRRRVQSQFPEVQFLDIMTVVDDATLKLATGGWAIKAFAALYAPFEQVIVADADCVFVQPPESLYQDASYESTGALLFHDRLLWRHAYQNRHEWWRSQIHYPSAALNKSLVWTEDYAEEGDSGVVVLDKSRLDVLMGLLHVAWQNTKAVRDEVTYKMTHGDKESWWFGLELSGAGYAFEEHYGSMVGWPDEMEQKDGKTQDKVCSFVIAHVDAADELIWYNGGLLKMKKGDQREFGLPTHLMIDGKWHKNGNKEEPSCMDGAPARALPEATIEILGKSISLAKEMDDVFGFLPLEMDTQ
ncbi:mannosyltransferase [Sarocladium implicatum]|nr:mannosyltransferase [Sarocladium implicatum]